MALVSRHEGVDEPPFPVRTGRAASSVIDAKSVAAE
jgi:hypothetical protein